MADEQESGPDTLDHSVAQAADRGIVDKLILARRTSFVLE